MVAHSCDPNYLGGGGRRMMSSRPAQAKLERPIQKQNGCRQGSTHTAVAYMQKAFSSILSAEKKKKKR
jgi:hypothetical protein